MEQISYIDRKTGDSITEKPPGASMLKFLYSTAFGKLSLNALFKRKLVSAVGGWYMNSKASAKRIHAFVTEHNMDLSEYHVPENGFKTFNDFFYRKVRVEARPIEDGVVSPADGKVLAFNNVSASRKFFVKGSEFNLKQFLNSEDLAKKFENGAMLIIRLAPTDYHRYHFPLKGKAGPSIKVRGDYYSVSPLALQKSLDIFLMNKREYTVLQTENAGDVLICDVGATMVGGIHQTYQSNSLVEKGQEKGYFAFGGSTLVVLAQKGKLSIAQDLIENTEKQLETAVKMGENIAYVNS